MEKPMTDKQAMPGRGMMPEGGQPPEPMPQDAGGTNQASPEEQGQYDQFVGRAMEIIYNRQMFPQVVEMLRGGGNDGQGKEETGQSGPAQGLAHAAAMIITRVFKAASDAGTAIMPDVLFHGGTEIFNQLAEISDQAGISNYAQDRDALEGAYFLAIDLTTKQLKAAGVIHEEEAKAAMQQLQEMDRNGEIESLFRDLDARDQATRGGAPLPANDNGPASKGGGMAPREME